MEGGREGARKDGGSLRMGGREQGEGERERGNTREGGKLGR